MFTSAGGISLCASSSFIDGGVRMKWIILDPDHWDIIEIKADEDAVAKWFKQRLGKKYDLLGLLGFVWRRSDGDKNKYFCSEALAASIGFKQAWRFDPNTLYEVLTQQEKVLQAELQPN